MYGKRETNQEGIMGHPTIYPTGVTVYNPEKCWNGFTLSLIHISEPTRH